MGSSSQKTKIIALTRALQIANGQWAKIYTDSKYVFLIGHTHSALCKERGFLTLKGTPIVNGPLIASLLETLQLPTEASIIHCWGHQSSKDPVALGNAKADSVAPGLAFNCSDSTEHTLFLTPSYQPCYQSKERDELIKREGTKKGWMVLFNYPSHPSSRPGIVDHFRHPPELTHSPQSTVQLLGAPLLRAIKLRDHISQVHSSCQACAQASPQRALHIHQSLHQLCECHRLILPIC